MKDKITLIFGDSIVYGVGDYEYGGWVNRLRIQLNNKTNNNYIFNLGIPGQTSKDIVKRFEEEIQNRFSEEDEFLLVFAFGIKDSLLLNENKNFINEFKINLKKIVEVSKRYTNKIFFLGLLNVDINIRSNYNYKNINKIEKYIKQIATQEEVNFIKMKDLLSNEDLIDGLHPNIMGHKKISDYIINKIYMED